MLSKAAVKYIQSLSFKKFRDENGLFVAEGPKVVEELIATGTADCKSLYGLEAYLTEKKHLFSSSVESFNIISEAELGKISHLKTPNQVVGVFSKIHSLPLKNLGQKITLVLDDINDPGNMGTIIRIADWFGVKDIVCSLHTVDVYNSKVVQSSMASLARVNIVYCDLVPFFESHKNVPVIAATLDGESVFKNSFSNGFLVIGNEANGIRQQIIERASVKISIPRVGKAESLNAAVATGIILGSFLKK